MSLELMCSPAFSVNGTAFEILEGSYKFDPDMNRLDTTTNFFPLFTMGNCKISITVKTIDHSCAKTYFKGVEATDVQLQFKTSPTAPGSNPEEYTFAAGTATLKIGNARVTECVELSGGGDKKQSEYSITFEAARKISDQSAPAITVTYA